MIFYGEEMMTASLVLMRRTLCWDAEDIIVLVTDAELELQHDLTARSAALTQQAKAAILVSVFVCVCFFML